MNKEKIEISVNEEDVQNIINCYEKDIEYIEQLEQENQQLKEENGRLKIKCRKIKKELKEEIKVLELIIGSRQKRNLIHKFDKEYDEEDKRKNPNRDYDGIIPDAEEVYKRYYEQQKRIKGLQEERDYLFDKLSIENQQLKEKYLNAVADYESEKSKNHNAIEHINKFEDIKAYYSYEEDGYEEYTYDEDFKIDLLEILKGGD